MKKILNFKELFEAATNFPSNISEIPSHEELSKLPSFLMFKNFMPASWVTGSVAYKNGTRTLGMGPVVSIDGKPFHVFNFYPLKGQIIRDGYTVGRCNLVTMDDWNKAVENMSNYFISTLLPRIGFRNNYNSNIAKLKAGKNPELMKEILTNSAKLDPFPGLIEYILVSALLNSEDSSEIVDLIYASPYKFKIMSSLKKNSPEVWKILKNKLGDLDSVEASADLGDLGF
jgi:hypothetical protein